MLSITSEEFLFYQRLSCCVASIKLEQIFLHSKEGKASIEGILILDSDEPLIDGDDRSLHFGK